MGVTVLQLTPRDPFIARDGRPLPSVVAGSFRAALVKADPALSFVGDMPQRLSKIEVAGVFPTAGGEFYFPAPGDCLWDVKTNRVHRVQPVPLESGEGTDLPDGSLQPVRLTAEQANDDLKQKAVPAWWPAKKYAEWLTSPQGSYGPGWFDRNFLSAATMETRRFAQITLSARVTIAENTFEHIERLNAWHPLGERRLVHWQPSETAELWSCPESIRIALSAAARIRMVLATPAIFEHGWRPGWLDAGTLTGRPIGGGPALRLVGVINRRWQEAEKGARRMVPAGSVYFFEVKPGEAAGLADKWLQPVSDSEQDRRDGFGLALWGSW
jgi:CRISPR-associated protein Cmr3